MKRSTIWIGRKSYQREAAYYTRQGDTDRAKTQMSYAESALDKYETQMSYARQADEKAAQYLKWAADALDR